MGYSRSENKTKQISIEENNNTDNVTYALKGCFFISMTFLCFERHFFIKGQSQIRSDRKYRLMNNKYNIENKPENCNGGTHSRLFEKGIKFGKIGLNKGGLQVE